MGTRQMGFFNSLLGRQAPRLADGVEGDLRGRAVHRGCEPLVRLEGTLMERRNVPHSAMGIR